MLQKFEFLIFSRKQVIVCFKDILKDKWSPALQIRTVLLSIQALLSAPNPDDPLANDVAQLWKQNERQAIKTAKFVTFSRGIIQI